MEISNAQIAQKLREVAAAYVLRQQKASSAYTLKKVSTFQIRAYETAANIIEQSSEEIKDLWEEKRLDQIPGLGESLKQHLDELFKTGKVKHWEAVKKGIPKVVFELLDIPGIGPKTASGLAKLGVKSRGDLKLKLSSGFLTKKGFSQKIGEKILAGLAQSQPSSEGRVLLPYAFAQAERVLENLKGNSDVVRADALGSLRRMVPTVGDLDFAVASKDPDKTIEHISSMSGVSRVVDKGERNISVMTSAGFRLDFIIIHPTSYGALLQHFTGSKKHNIHLRTLAEKKHFSLSEYGVKNLKTGEIIPTEKEEELYSLLKMETPPPEIREDAGEIEAALAYKLPKLVELKDIKGDLHVHSNFPIEPSHDPGADSIEEIVKEAKKLDYIYIGISNHSPSTSGHTQEEIVNLIQKQTKKIEQINSSIKGIRVLNLLEVDILPDGRLSVPDEGLKLLDFAIAGVHSVHHMSEKEMTTRILRALENPYIRVLAHPTGRILNERSAYEVEWEKVFKLAAQGKKALEINAFPNRLDLTDTMVREAKSSGVKLTIGTDSHQITQMGNMQFGVAMARRGWAEEDDIVNTWTWTKFAQWFNIRS